jgi:outer membrane protein assembly factor BamA
MDRKKLFAFLLLMATSVSTVTAQLIPAENSARDIDQSRIGSHYSVFPLAGYSSDFGFYGGGFLQRMNYGVDQRPFLSNTRLNGVLSTKGNLELDLEYERIRTFGTDIRSKVEIIGLRLLQGHYFGIGNNTEFSENLFDSDYFFFERREFQFDYQARKRVHSYGEFGVLDLFSRINIWHVNGIEKEHLTKFLIDQPEGYNPGWVNSIGLGFIADSRDSEFDPKLGYRYSLEFSKAIPFLGSDYSVASVTGDVRHYKTLFANIVFAHNFKFEHQTGDAPFWSKPVIGNEYGLRGFHWNRFRGSSSVLSMTELRTWLFTVWDGRIRAGGQLFWDTGRVYSENDSNAIFDAWKHSYGAGAALSLFNPDFIVRADAGFSDEAFRIYFGAGYVF